MVPFWKRLSGKDITPSVWSWAGLKEKGIFGTRQQIISFVITSVQFTIYFENLSTLDTDHRKIIKYESNEVSLFLLLSLFFFPFLQSIIKSVFSWLTAANVQSLLRQGLLFKPSAHSIRTSNICLPDAGGWRGPKDLNQVNNNLWTAGVNLSQANTSSDRMAN